MTQHNRKTQQKKLRFVLFLHRLKQEAEVDTESQSFYSNNIRSQWVKPSDKNTVTEPQYFLVNKDSNTEVSECSRSLAAPSVVVTLPLHSDWCGPPAGTRTKPLTPPSLTSFSIPLISPHPPSSPALYPWPSILVPPSLRPIFGLAPPSPVGERCSRLQVALDLFCHLNHHRILLCA